MLNKPILETSEALAMLSAAHTFAQSRGWPVSIAVVDDTGQLLAFLRMDGASPVSGDFAIAKATTSARGRRTTQSYEAMLNEGRFSLATGSKLTCIEGGVPINHSGHWLGAVGVSGVASAQDAEIANAAVQYHLTCSELVTAPAHHQVRDQ